MNDRDLMATQALVAIVIGRAISNEQMDPDSFRSALTEGLGAPVLLSIGGIDSTITIAESWAEDAYFLADAMLKQSTKEGE